MEPGRNQAGSEGFAEVKRRFALLNHCRNQMEPGRNQAGNEGFAEVKRRFAFVEPL